MTLTLSDLKALDAKATKGPWQQSHRKCDDQMWRTQIYDSDDKEIATFAWYPVKRDNTLSTQREANVEFVVACVAYVRAELAKAEKAG